MSRIRSIHPSQWTDEAFVECSAFARLLALGLRNEADDNGIFKWTPVGLKMRLFPADNVDVGTLLDELERQRIVLRFEAEGRTYGAIRNFRVFQNPRSPKTEHPLPPEADAFVGARAGDDAAEKKPVGRPRKQHDDETPPTQQKPFPQSAENNSERRGEESKEEESPSDSSIGKPLDQGADGQNDEGVADPVVHLPVIDHAGEAFAAYEALRREFVPAARSLDFGPDRRRKLTVRLRDVGGPDGWRDILASIRGSPFLRGETSRNGFVAIDWLLEHKNLRKVTEVILMKAIAPAAPAPLVPPPPSTPSVPPALLSALADRQFVADGSARWSVDHAQRVLATNGAAGLIEKTLAELQRAASPVPRDWLGDRLSVLWTMFMASRAQSDASALTVWLAEHLRLLGDLPHDLVAFAIDKAVQSARHGFIPSIGEIRTIAEPLAEERDELIRRLRLIAAA